MTLRAAITNDAATVFLSTDEFAELVTYQPHRFFGSALRADRSIKAVVIRSQATVLTEDGDTICAQWEVHVANDSILGISGAELDTGGDAILLPPRDGETAETKRILHLVTQDHGMLVLECR